MDDKAFLNRFLTIVACVQVLDMLQVILPKAGVLFLLQWIY
jgi:hypothetical protein